MATSNQEILAQLEKLMRAQEASGGPNTPITFGDGEWDDCADFSTLLAAVKRLVKIEEAAKANEKAWEAFNECENGEAYERLEAAKAADRKFKAALKEPS